jgi:hypothetical protein
LERILREGGSAYELDRTSQRPASRKRISAAAQPPSRTQPRVPRTPAPLLAEAWEKAFHRSPDPSAAYARAVQAVEAAAVPVVSPSNANATLSKMARALRDKPENWETPPTTPATTAPARRVAPQQVSAVLVLAAQMDLLWRNHSDRRVTVSRIRSHSPRRSSPCTKP